MLQISSEQTRRGRREKEMEEETAQKLILFDFVPRVSGAYCRFLFAIWDYCRRGSTLSAHFCEIRKGYMNNRFRPDLAKKRAFHLLCEDYQTTVNAQIRTLICLYLPYQT